MRVYKSEKGKRWIYESYDRLLLAWDVPIQEREIESSYGTTHVIEAGAKDNQPLLLFHGVGDDSALMWVYNAKALSQHFHLIAIDALGGPGKSLPNAQYAKGFDTLNWLDELFEALEITKTHVAGVSYGCYLVQLLMSQMPDKVSRAVGMAGLPTMEGQKVNKLRSILRFLPEALFPSDKNCMRLIKKLTGSNAQMFYNHTEIWNHWKLLLRHFNQQSMMAHKVEPIDAAKLLKQREKMLFLVGECELGPKDAAMIQAIDEAGFRLKIIKDAGHAINHEQAGIVNREIIEFLSLA